MDFKRVSETTGMPIAFLKKASKNLSADAKSKMESHFQVEFVKEDHEHLRIHGDDYYNEMVAVALSQL